MIRLLFMDVDGTLTDGKIIIDSKGNETKEFSVKDGMGIKTAMSLGIIPVVITGRISSCVDYRCKELGITECYQGIPDKLIIIEKMISKYSVAENEVAYIGDDINDLPAIQRCNQHGYSGAPSDAAQLVLSSVSFVSKFRGGEGAVREFIDYLIDKG